MSPKLLMSRDLELAVPGTYEPHKSIIHIRHVHPSLNVITSKQRPRKLCITGDGRGEGCGRYHVHQCNRRQCNHYHHHRYRRHHHHHRRRLHHRHHRHHQRHYHHQHHHRHHHHHQNQPQQHRDGYRRLPIIIVITLSIAKKSTKSFLAFLRSFVCVAGSNGAEFMFLLKGHEDLRQDERVMQLFGLVNTLLASDQDTSKRHLR